MMKQTSVVGRMARRWARWFLLAAALALFSSIVVAATGNAASTAAVAPVTTPNPRCGVAGVWKQSVLQSLYVSQVPTGTPEPGGYTWEALTPCNEVQMVRPCKFFESSHVSPPQECYDVDTGMIPNGYESTFSNLVATTYAGRVWLIGNEPDRLDQDNITPTQYARMYHYYYNLIKAADPSATIATAGFSHDPSAGDVYTSGWRWASEVLTAYQATYSTTMPIDVWNFHLYNDYDYEFTTVRENIEEWIYFIETTRDGTYSTTQVWLTEWGKLDGWVEPDRSPEDHIHNEKLHPDLVRLMWDWAEWMEARGEIDRWFWFVGGMGDWNLDIDFEQTAWLLEPEIDYFTNTIEGDSTTTLVDPSLPTPEQNTIWVGATLFVQHLVQGRKVTGYDPNNDTLTVGEPFPGAVSGTYGLLKFGYATPVPNFLGGAYAYFCNPGVFTNTLHLPVTMREDGGDRAAGGDFFSSPLATPAALESPLATPTPRPAATPAETGAVSIDDFNYWDSPTEHGWIVLDAGGELRTHNYKFDSPKLHPVGEWGTHANFRFTFPGDPAGGEALALARGYLSFEVGDIDGWWAAADVRGDDGREYRLRYEPRFGATEVLTEDGRTTVVHPIGEGYAEAGYFQDVGRNLSADLSAGVPGVGVALVNRLTFYGPGYLDDVMLQEPAFPDDNTPPVTQVRLEGTLGSQGWYTSPVRMLLSARDEAGGSGVNEAYYRYNGMPWELNHDHFSLMVRDGRGLIEGYVVDRAGNVEEVVTAELSIDQTPPVVRIEAPVAGEYSPESTLAVAYAAEDATSGVEQVVVKLDGVELGGARQLRTWTLEPGLHTLEVTAADAAGWQTSARRTFTVSGW